ncbi:hypothetical protein N0O92_09885 [Alkalihalobacillus sp. MEB130]|uniref:hypothetical protein n=1 Tax=Alkalihalobacillus sp. MEB130 TaxID=2976704 RepID=UPI0028DE0B44|nr:hypothetical protein [Alkalihalobacillus sp. MEB130]MDT8860544.1 hypothetical protein [Alkalihalobacillus sp. MEB130]
MDNFQSIKLLDMFRTVFVKMGVDYDIMRQILRVKLTMDQRRVPTIFTQSNSKKKEGNQFLKSLWLYALFGLILIPFILLGEHYLFQMSIVFGIAMFIIMTSMISDFSSVLLDIRDKPILQTKPVDRKTISASKFVHVLIYLFFLTAAIMTIPLIVSLFVQGFLFFLLFLVEMIFLNLLIIVMTAMMYWVILRFFDGEKLMDLINYVQILLSLGTIIGYQLVIRSFEFLDLNIEITMSWWQFLLPPMWYAAPFEWLLNGNGNVYILIHSGLAFVIPVICMFLYIKMLPSFERNLQKLSNQKMSKKNRNQTNVLEKWICRSKEERTFFRFAKVMMKQEREFKLKVYPSLGLAIILPFLLFYNEFRYRTVEEITSGHLYLVIYVCLIVIPTIIMMLKFSGTYKGAWIYRVTPLQQMAPIYKGTLKAFLVKLFLPIFVIVSLVFGVIFSTSIIPHLVVVFLSSLIYTVICYLSLEKALPFSESFRAGQQGEGLAIFVMILLIGPFVGLHYLSSLLPFGVYVYLVILFFVNYLMWNDRIFNRGRI